MGCDPQSPEHLDPTAAALRAGQRHGLENVRQLAAGPSPDNVEHAAARLFANLSPAFGVPLWLELPEPERQTWRRAAAKLLAELDAGARAASASTTALERLVSAGIVQDLSDAGARLRDSIARAVAPTAEATRRPRRSCSPPLTPWQRATRRTDQADPFWDL